MILIFLCLDPLKFPINRLLPAGGGARQPPRRRPRRAEARDVAGAAEGAGRDARGRHALAQAGVGRHHGARQGIAGGAGESLRDGPRRARGAGVVAGVLRLAVRHRNNRRR